MAEINGLVFVSQAFLLYLLCGLISLFTPLHQLAFSPNCTLYISLGSVKDNLIIKFL